MDTLADLKRNASEGLTRANLTPRVWHSKHRDAVPFLFGFDASYDEFIIMVTEGFTWLPKLGHIGRMLSTLNMDLLHNYMSEEDADTHNVLNSSQAPMSPARYFFGACQESAIVHPRAAVRR